MIDTNHNMNDLNFRNEIDQMFRDDNAEYRGPLETLDIDSQYYELDQINISGSKYMYHTLHINIQGLLSSLDKLQHMLHILENNNIVIDVIMLCETFLRASLGEQFIQTACAIPGYDFVCRNRVNKLKGGVAIYINRRYKYKVRHDLSLFIEGEFESIFIELLSKPRNVIVGEIYRVPGTPAQEAVARYELILTNLMAVKSSDIIIGTDQNFDYIRINEHNHTADLFNAHISHGLIPVITRPTRITHQTASLIDNIYIKLHGHTHIQSGIITTSISDHLPVFAFYGKPTGHKLNKTEIQRRDLNEININTIKTRLNTCDWQPLLDMNSNTGLNYFMNELNKIIDNVAPIKTKIYSAKRRIREPWITQSILKSSKHVDTLYRHSLNKPKDHPNSILFRQYRNKFIKTKKVAKQNYFHNLFQEHSKDIRKCWEIMRNIIKKSNDKSTISDTFMVNNKELTSPAEISQEFCNFFTNVGPDLSKKIPLPTKTYDKYMNTKPPINSLFLNPTSPFEINSLIKLMKAKKSSGHDNISSWLIKQLNVTICSPIAIIINKSMSEGMFPDDLKIAKIIPIYKSKEKHYFNNYRPISLLSSISKLYEKIVYTRLYNFLNPAFYDRQFGFRAKRSTIQAIIELNSDIIESYENKQITMSTFLDLSKAFDTIDHEILINKLRLYGIRGVSLNWFRSYLTNRRHYVHYKDNSSPFSNMICGVPQGSVLGPLLFIIYTNDLPQCLKHTKCILFADDTTIYTSDSNLDQLYASLNADLIILSDWFKANKLSLNIGKTVYMIFNKPPNIDVHTELKLGSEVIKQTNHTKFLGLIIDNELKWTNHIQHVKSKLASSLYALRSSKNILNGKHLKTIYNAMFQPYLDYGIIIWGTAAKHIIKPIETQQKKAIRLISNSPYNAHTASLYKKHNILTIADLHQLHVSKFMYHLNENSLPNVLAQLFTPNHEIHPHNTRHRNHPHFEARRTAMANHDIIHKGPKIWNNIHPKIKNATSVHSFTRQIKQTLIREY